MIKTNAYNGDGMIRQTNQLSGWNPNEQVKL